MIRILVTLALAIATTSPTPAPAAPAAKPSPPPVHAKAGARPLSLSTYWYLSLTAGETGLAPRQQTTLTATANQDVGPTPYYIEIFDLTVGGFQRACGFGTTCSVTVARTGSEVDDYVAVVSLFGTVYQPPGLQVVSNLLTISWISVSLTAAPYTLLWTPTATTTLTATASMDVGPTPFWIGIFDYDVDTVNPIALCGFGATCRAFPSQNEPTTHQYFADIYRSTPSGVDIRAGSQLISVTWYD